MSVPESRRIALDISDLMARKHPADRGTLDETEVEVRGMVATRATHQVAPLRPIAVIEAEIRRATVPGLRREDC